MFAYQYCAIYYNSLGQISYIDGVAILKEKIKTMDDYRELKVEIDKYNAHKLVITNLSLI